MNQSERILTVPPAKFIVEDLRVEPAIELREQGEPHSGRLAYTASFRRLESDGRPRSRTGSILFDPTLRRAFVTFEGRSEAAPGASLREALAAFLRRHAGSIGDDGVFHRNRRLWKSQNRTPLRSRDPGLIPAPLRGVAASGTQPKPIRSRP